MCRFKSCRPHHPEKSDFIGLFLVGINIILGQVNEALVTAYGLYYKIQQFILFAAFGLRDTITPIVSFASGMQKKKRIVDGMKYGVGYTLIIMAVGTLVLELFASRLCAAFSLSEETEKLCISAARIISAGFIFCGISISLQGVFQALNCGISSLVISVLRQLVLVLPVAWIFTLLITVSSGNEWIVWLTFPIAEIITAAIAVVLMYRAYAHKIRSI